MLDFKIAQEDLANTLDLMTNARTSSSNEVMDLTLLRSVARFVVTGRDTECAVEAEAPGFAQLPVDLLPKLLKTAESFPDNPIRIRIEDAKVRIQSVSISHPGIALTMGRVRVIDLPDDASTLDLLAVRDIFSPSEIEQSGLAAQVQLARKKALAAVESAANSLVELGVDRSEVETMVARHVAQHTVATRKVLRP